MSENREDYLDFQTRERAKSDARREINIFHQLHVINAPLAKLNKEWTNLAKDIVDQLPSLAGGIKLHQHIQNLKTGMTPLDKIDPDLLPFGKEVFDDEKLYKDYTDYDKEHFIATPPKLDISFPTAPKEPKNSIQAVWSALRGYDNTPEALDAFKSLPAVAKLGADWADELRRQVVSSKLPDSDHLSQVLESLISFDEAVTAWSVVSSFIRSPNGDSREKLLPHLAEYKEKLDLFGEPGLALKSRLENLLGEN